MNDDFDYMLRSNSPNTEKLDELVSVDLDEDRHDLHGRDIMAENGSLESSRDGLTQSQKSESLYVFFSGTVSHSLTKSYG